jgi:hypothetical protein
VPRDRDRKRREGSCERQGPGLPERRCLIRYLLKAAAQGGALTLNVLGDIYDMYNYRECWRFVCGDVLTWCTVCGQKVSRTSTNELQRSPVFSVPHLTLPTSGRASKREEGRGRGTRRKNEPGHFLMPKASRNCWPELGGEVRGTRMRW